MTRLIDLTVTATANSDGHAVVTFSGPGNSFDVLTVDVIVCTSDSGRLPDVTLYRGDPAADRRLSYNPDGRSGSFRGGGTADRIGAGDSWALRWSRCDPGATCTATLTGTVARRNR